ncbi:uncharacterized protein BKA78DRAFT_305119 [Phyllosticta capitalensis]|uniref:uncharacterized protein n=1 Tax=Phyllosticta capitalensis TaxID=121624 RepID=UPI0031319968
MSTSAIHPARRVHHHPISRPSDPPPCKCFASSPHPHKSQPAHRQPAIQRQPTTRRKRNQKTSTRQKESLEQGQEAKCPPAFPYSYMSCILNIGNAPSIPFRTVPACPYPFLHAAQPRRDGFAFLVSSRFVLTLPDLNRKPHRA